jgi:hypothetical protein
MVKKAKTTEQMQIRNARSNFGITKGTWKAASASWRATLERLGKLGVAKHCGKDSAPS